MHWIWKIMAFKMLGMLPGGEAVHYFMQKNNTHSLLVTEGTVLGKLQAAVEYLDFMEQVLNIKDFNGITHVDIGAGWMPTIPLLFYSVGFEGQLLCDIRHNLYPNIFSDVISTFRKVVLQERNLEARCRRLPPLMNLEDTLENYLMRIGIRYIAPYSRVDLLEENVFKLITCTQVLFHLNEHQLRHLFQAIASALKYGGMFMASIDLLYNIADFDRDLSPYNKWRYSDFVWEGLFNSKMMSYNRLTTLAYRQLLQESGLEIMAFHVVESTTSDLKKLRHSKVHKQFRHVPERELAAKHLFFAAKREGTDVSFPHIP